MRFLRREGIGQPGGGRGEQALPLQQRSERLHAEAATRAAQEAAP